MDTQKDYINYFRKEAEAIVSQQLADLKAQESNNQEGAATVTAQASSQQIAALEEELRASMDNVLREASGAESKEAMRNELLNFYQDYVADFTQRAGN